MIDLSPSIFSYNSTINDITANTIPSIVKKFIQSLYESSDEINAQVEVGIICVRMPNDPIRVIIQSYQLQNFEDSLDIIDQLTYYLQTIQAQLGKTISSIFSQDKPEGAIEFTTSLK